MATLKARDAQGNIHYVAAGRDGAQGKPGPASPHEGSNIATSVRAWGAAGDGTADDTMEILAAIAAAGNAGYLDAEAGSYRVTDDLDKAFWALAKAGPGVVIGPGGEEVIVAPFADADTTTIYVNGDTGDDDNSGLFSSKPLRTLAGVRSIFDVSGPVMGGNLIIRLSGTIRGGMRFQTPPLTKTFIRFEGGPLDANGRPTTWIENDTGDAERFGLRFEEGQQMRVHLARLGFRGFNTGGGAGWIIKSGGFIRTEDCWTENCQIGSLYTGSVGFSEQRSRHRDYTTSGTRVQYNSSGSWTEVQCLGGPNATEGFHISRNAVAHVDKCVAQDHTRSGTWADMAARVASAGSTYQRNGWYGVRGEGHATIHIDDSTYGVHTWGAGADQNVRKDVSLAGLALIAGTEGVYGTRDLIVESWRGTRTTAHTAARGLPAYRVGEASRLAARAWGTGAGTVRLHIGGTTLATLTIPAAWIVDLSIQHDGTAWIGYATINGGAPVMITQTWGRTAAAVTITPGAGVTLRGVEHSTGG